MLFLELTVVTVPLYHWDVQHAFKGLTQTSSPKCTMAVPLSSTGHSSGLLECCYSYLNIALYGMDTSACPDWGHILYENTTFSGEMWLLFAIAFIVWWCHSTIPFPLGLYATLKKQYTFHLFPSVFLNEMQYHCPSVICPLQEYLVQDICNLVCSAWLHFPPNGHPAWSKVSNHEIDPFPQSFPVMLYWDVAQHLHTQSWVNALSNNIRVNLPGKIQGFIHTHVMHDM